MSDTYRYLLTFLLAFFLNLTLEKYWIIYQKKKKMGQIVKEELTQHQFKEKTPTMGGIPLLISSYLAYFLFFTPSKEMWILTFLVTGYFLIGTIDDYLKRKNQKGLKGIVRLLSEILFFTLFIFLLPRNLDIYFSLSNFTLPFGICAYLFLLFITVGGANACNLTDGLDGLLGGLLLVALFPLIVVSLKQNNAELSGFLLSFIGSLLAFLVYNTNPAQIFLGDSGSLSLGVLFVSTCYLLGILDLLPIIGIVFVIETISVIMQVISFQLFHKRIFLMTPLHHHFEKKGVSEVRITLFYYLFAYGFAILAIYLYLC